jgi:hypothetical protein
MTTHGTQLVRNQMTDYLLLFITNNDNIPYILESNPHPNLIRTQFLATS